jgi:hypothetical protein
MANKMKYYNFETMFISLATKIGDFLHNNAIYFELSKNGRYYHFEILTDQSGAVMINNFIDQFKIVEEA